jgi:hypothetical protein
MEKIGVHSVAELVSLAEHTGFLAGVAVDPDQDTKG